MRSGRTRQAASQIHETWAARSHDGSYLIDGWKEGVNHEASHVPRAHVESISGPCNSVLESEGVRAAIKACALAQGMESDDENVSCQYT